MHMNISRTLFYTLLIALFCAIPSVAKAQSDAQLVYVYLSPSPADGGTIKCVGKDGTVYKDYPQQIAVGTEVSVTITPNPGYRISYIDCNGTEYQESDGSLQTLLAGGKIATFSATAGEKKLRIACEFLASGEETDPTITIEQLDSKLGRIEVIDTYTMQQIASGQVLEEGDEISVTAYEYDNARIKTLHIGNKSYSREKLTIEDNATEAIEYTVQGSIKIYCEYTQEVANTLSLTWDTPRHKRELSKSSMPMAERSSRVEPC